MLLIHFSLAPTESIQELEGADRSTTRLQVVENSLNAEGDRFEIVYVRGHLVHSSSERSDKEESLKKRVQVTGRALID
jgi:hypothetical protein